MRKEKTRKKNWLVVAGLVVMIDRWIKLMVRTDGDNYRLNSGIVWGWGQGQKWIGVVVVVLILLLILVRKKDWWLGLIVGGGLANLGDRVIYGGVIDYIKLPYYWLWFNLADVSVTLGLMVWWWQEVRWNRK